MRRGRSTLAIAALALALACRESDTRPPAPGAAPFNLGRAPLPDEIAAWDIDVNPTGTTLPPGNGTAAEGARIFAAKCASCHGARGEGMHPAYPALIGVEPRDFSFDDDPKKQKTVGNYWPYATTLFDYLK
jgi:cytochrome c